MPLHSLVLSIIFRIQVRMKAIDFVSKIAGILVTLGCWRFTPVPSMGPRCNMPLTSRNTSTGWDAADAIEAENMSFNPCCHHHIGLRTGLSKCSVGLTFAFLQYRSDCQPCLLWVLWSPLMGAKWLVVIMSMVQQDHRQGAIFYFKQHSDMTGKNGQKVC